MVVIGDCIISYFRGAALGYCELAASGIGEKEGSHMAILVPSSFSLAAPLLLRSFCYNFRIE